MDSGAGRCWVCEGGGRLWCSSCRFALYCSLACQKKDRLRHLDECMNSSRRRVWCGYCGREEALGGVACQDCLSAAYCSDSCKQMDGKNHRAICLQAKEKVVEAAKKISSWNRRAKGIPQYLGRLIHAVDYVRWSENEGARIQAASFLSSKQQQQGKRPARDHQTRATQHRHQHTQLTHQHYTNESAKTDGGQRRRQGEGGTSCEEAEVGMGNHHQEKQEEEEEEEGPLRMLLLGADIKHILCTLHETPDFCKQGLETTLVDASPHILARDLLVLYLLMLPEAPTDPAALQAHAEKVVMVFYSVCLDMETHALLCNTLHNLLNMPLPAFLAETRQQIQVDAKSYALVQAVWSGWMSFANDPGALQRLEKVRTLKMSGRMVRDVLARYIKSCPRDHQRAVMDWIKRGSLKRGRGASFPNVTLACFSPLKRQHLDKFEDVNPKWSEETEWIKVVKADEEMIYAPHGIDMIFQDWDYKMVSDSIQEAVSVVEMYRHYLTKVFARVSYKLILSTLITFNFLRLNVRDLAADPHILTGKFDRIATGIHADLLGTPFVLQNFGGFLRSDNIYARLLTHHRVWSLCLDWRSDQQARESCHKSLKLNRPPNPQLMLTGRWATFRHFLQAELLHHFHTLDRRPLEPENVPAFRSVRRAYDMVLSDYTRQLNHIVPFRFQAEKRMVSMVDSRLHTLEWHRLDRTRRTSAPVSPQPASPSSPIKKDLNPSSHYVDKLISLSQQPPTAPEPSIPSSQRRMRATSLSPPPVQSSPFTDNPQPRSQSATRPRPRSLYISSPCKSPLLSPEVEFWEQHHLTQEKPKTSKVRAFTEIPEGISRRIQQAFQLDSKKEKITPKSAPVSPNLSRKSKTIKEKADAFERGTPVRSTFPETRKTVEAVSSSTPVKKLVSMFTRAFAIRDKDSDASKKFRRRHSLHDSSLTYDEKMEIQNASFTNSLRINRGHKNKMSSSDMDETGMSTFPRRARPHSVAVSKFSYLDGCPDKENLVKTEAAKHQEKKSEVKAALVMDMTDNPQHKKGHESPIKSLIAGMNTMSVSPVVPRATRKHSHSKDDITVKREHLCLVNLRPGSPRLPSPVSPSALHTIDWPGAAATGLLSCNSDVPADASCPSRPDSTSEQCSASAFPRISPSTSPIGRNKIKKSKHIPTEPEYEAPALRSPTVTVRPPTPEVCHTLGTKSGPQKNMRAHTPHSSHSFAIQEKKADGLDSIFSPRPSPISPEMLSEPEPSPSSNLSILYTKAEVTVETPKMSLPEKRYKKHEKDDTAFPTAASGQVAKHEETKEAVARPTTTTHNKDREATEAKPTEPSSHQSEYTETWSLAAESMSLHSQDTEQKESQVTPIHSDAPRQQSLNAETFNLHLTDSLKESNNVTVVHEDQVVVIEMQDVTSQEITMSVEEFMCLNSTSLSSSLTEADMEVSALLSQEEKFLPIPDMTLELQKKESMKEKGAIPKIPVKGSKSDIVITKVKPKSYMKKETIQHQISKCEETEPYPKEEKVEHKSPNVNFKKSKITSFDPGKQENSETDHQSFTEPCKKSKIIDSEKVKQVQDGKNDKSSTESITDSKITDSEEVKQVQDGKNDKSSTESITDSKTVETVEVEQEENKSPESTANPSQEEPQPKTPSVSRIVKQFTQQIQAQQDDPGNLPLSPKRDTIKRSFWSQVIKGPPKDKITPKSLICKPEVNKMEGGSVAAWEGAVDPVDSVHSDDGTKRKETISLSQEDHLSSTVFGIEDYASDSPVYPNFKVHTIPDPSVTVQTYETHPNPTSFSPSSPIPMLDSVKSPSPTVFSSQSLNPLVHAPKSSPIPTPCSRISNSPTIHNLPHPRDTTFSPISPSPSTPSPRKTPSPIVPPKPSMRTTLSPSPRLPSSPALLSPCHSLGVPPVRRSPTPVKEMVEQFTSQIQEQSAPPSPRSPRPSSIGTLIQQDFLRLYSASPTDETDSHEVSCPAREETSEMVIFDLSDEEEEPDAREVATHDETKPITIPTPPSKVTGSYASGNLNEPTTLQSSEPEIKKSPVESRVSELRHEFLQMIRGIERSQPQPADSRNSEVEASQSASQDNEQINISPSHDLDNGPPTTQADNSGDLTVMSYTVEVTTRGGYGEAGVSALSMVADKENEGSNGDCHELFLAGHRDGQHSEDDSVSPPPSPSPRMSPTGSRSRRLTLTSSTLPSSFRKKRGMGLPEPSHRSATLLRSGRTGGLDKLTFRKYVKSSIANEDLGYGLIPPPPPPRIMPSSSRVVEYTSSFEVSTEEYQANPALVEEAVEALSFLTASPASGRGRKKFTWRSDDEESDEEPLVMVRQRSPETERKIQQAKTKLQSVHTPCDEQPEEEHGVNPTSSSTRNKNAENRNAETVSGESACQSHSATSDPGVNSHNEPSNETESKKGSEESSSGTGKETWHFSWGSLRRRKKAEVRVAAENAATPDEAPTTQPEASSRGGAYSFFFDRRKTRPANESSLSQMSKSEAEVTTDDIARVDNSDGGTPSIISVAHKLSEKDDHGQQGTVRRSSRIPTDIKLKPKRKLMLQRDSSSSDSFSQSLIKLIAPSADNEEDQESPKERLIPSEDEMRSPTGEDDIMARSWSPVSARSAPDVRSETFSLLEEGEPLSYDERRVEARPRVGVLKTSRDRSRESRRSLRVSWGDLPERTDCPSSDADTDNPEEKSFRVTQL